MRGQSDSRMGERKDKAMKFINVEFNTTNVQAIKGLNLTETKYVSVYTDHQEWSNGIIALTEQEYSKYLSLKSKTGVAESDAIEHIMAMASVITDDAVEILENLDSKIQDLIKNNNITIEKDGDYYTINEKGFENFCHHDKTEALYFYFLETMFENIFQTLF